MLRIFLFGSPRFFSDDAPLHFNAPPKTLPLLAYLLLTRERVSDRAHVASRLWPDDTDSAARTNLRRHLHYLQQALPPDRSWLVTTATTVGWNPAAEAWLDVADFERFSASTAMLERAVTLYAGDLLLNVYDDWVFEPRERLRNLYAHDLAGLIETAQARRDFAPAIGWAQHLCAHEPLREDAVRTLIRLHYQAGDRAGALKEYDRFKRLIKHELDLEPMPETQALYEAIRHDLHRSITVANQAPVLPPELPFAGREAELARLHAQWQQTLDRHGGLVLISGEAGVGKSRLVAEFASTLAAPKPLQLQGNTERAEPRPYHAIGAALSGAPDRLLELDPMQRATLALIVPALQALSTEPLPPLDAAQTRTRLFDAIATCLETWSPLILVLEDVHWAGHATLDLLEFLARRCAAQRALIIVTYRDAEAPHLMTATWGEHLPLGRLSAAAIEHMLSSLALAARLRQDLIAACDGQPLFLDLMLRASTPHDKLPRAGLPREVRRLIRTRLDQLSPTAYAFAEAAAVLGVAFRASLACEVLGWTEAQTAAALSELLDQRLLRDIGRRAGPDYEFSHHLIQACLYDELAPDRARRRHQRAAQLIEAPLKARVQPIIQHLRARYEGEVAIPDLLDLPISEVARHYDRAGVASAAIDYYSIEALLCLAVAADDEALAKTSRALELAGPLSPPLPIGWWFRVIGWREAIFHRLGQRVEQSAELDRLRELALKQADFDLQCEVARRQIEYARGCSDRESERRVVAELAQCAQRSTRVTWLAEAARQSGMLLHLLGDYPEARTKFETALALYRQADSVTGQIACATGLAELEIQRWQPQAARQWIETAFAVPGIQQQEYLLEPVLWSAGAAALTRKDWLTCLEFSSQLLALAGRLHDRNWEAAAHNLIGQVHAWQFHIQLARDHLSLAGTIYQDIGKEYAWAMVLSNEGLLALTVGDYVRAFGCFERAEQIQIKTGMLRNQAITAINQGSAAACLDDYELACRYALKARDLAQRVAVPYLEAYALSNLAEAERNLGRFAEAITHYRAAEALFVAIDQPTARHVLIAELALTYAYADQLAAARPLLAEALAAYADVAAYVDDPQRVLWAGYEIERLAGNIELATPYVTRAYEEVMTRAASIPDEASRCAYLALRLSRDIVAAHDAGRKRPGG